MEMKALGDALKKSVQDTANNIKEATKDVKMPEIKAPDIKKVKMPEIKIPEQIKNLGKAKREEQNPEELQGFIGISIENALMIIYCLMAVDGSVDEEEEAKLLSIGERFMDGFADIKDTLVEECQKRIEVESGVREQYVAIEHIVEDLLKGITQGKIFMNPRLFVWDLLTIAYSDNKYDENERRLIDFIVKIMKIDEATFLEMQSSMLTVMDIEKEISWIKTTDRPYLRIETVVNELEDRKKTILGSIMELIIA